MNLRIGLIALLCGGVLFLAGCSNTPDDTIQFSQFSFPSPTVIVKQNFGAATKYTIEGKSASGDSLLIVQEPIDPNTSYTGWMESNIDTLMTQYPRLSLNTQDDASFDCKGDNVAGSIAQRTATSAGENEDPLYLAQYFFIYKANAFVLSFTSLTEDATDAMVRYRHDISCN